MHEGNVVVLTNGFSRKSQKTPAQEIALAEQKAASPGFAEGYDEGYRNFRIGVMLKQA